MRTAASRCQIAGTFIFLISMVAVKVLPVADVARQIVVREESNVFPRVCHTVSCRIYLHLEPRTRTDVETGAELPVRTHHRLAFHQHTVERKVKSGSEINRLAQPLFCAQSGGVFQQPTPERTASPVIYIKRTERLVDHLHIDRIAEFARCRGESEC